MPTPNPFTPAGTGTVIDNATDEDGKEFFTIMTPAENVFYLIIDRQRETENVYFLNAVTEADLMALAEIPETPAPAPVPEPTPAPVTPEPEPEPEKSGGIGAFILVVAIVLIGGGAAWYFKIYRPKQQGGAMEEDDYDPAESEGYGIEGDAPWPDDEDAPPEDDGPPWDDDYLPNEGAGNE
jgi:hypothetical protein